MLLCSCEGGIAPSSPPSSLMYGPAPLAGWRVFLGGVEKTLCLLCPRRKICYETCARRQMPTRMLQKVGSRGNGFVHSQPNLRGGQCWKRPWICNQRRCPGLVTKSRPATHTIDHHQTWRSRTRHGTGHWLYCMVPRQPLWITLPSLQLTICLPLPSFPVQAGSQ